MDGLEGGGKTLKDAGAIFADDFIPQKARILLMLALQNGVENFTMIQQLFDK
jgi:L-asparaginase